MFEYSFESEMKLNPILDGGGLILLLFEKLARYKKVNGLALKL